MTSIGLAVGVIEAFEGVLEIASVEGGLPGGVPGGVCGNLRSEKIQQLSVEARSPKVGQLKEIRQPIYQYRRHLEAPCIVVYPV